MSVESTHSGESKERAIALDHTRLLGYWLLPEDRLERLGDDRHAVHLKMGNKGGTKFFGGNAGIKRRVS